MRNLRHLQRGSPRHYQRGFLGSVIAAGIGLVAADKSSKEARKGRKSAERALERQETRLDAQEARAQFLFDEFKRTFLPVERKLAAEADRGLNVERFTGEAVADVQQSFDKASEIATRNLQRFGVNPSSGRFAGLNRNIELARAASEAGAITGTRRFIEDTDFSRRAAVANLGRGLPALAVGAGRRGAGSAGGFAGLAQQSAADAGKTAEFFSRLPFEDLFKSKPKPNTTTNVIAPGGQTPGVTRLGGRDFNFQEGGLVGPEGGTVEPGEFVMSAEDVLFKGTEFFEKLMMKSRGLPNKQEAA